MTQSYCDDLEESLKSATSFISAITQTQSIIHARLAIPLLVLHAHSLMVLTANNIRDANSLTVLLNISQSHSES